MGNILIKSVQRSFPRAVLFKISCVNQLDCWRNLENHLYFAKTSEQSSKVINVHLTVYVYNNNSDVINPPNIEK